MKTGQALGSIIKASLQGLQGSISRQSLHSTPDSVACALSLQVLVLPHSHNFLSSHRVAGVTSRRC